MHEATSLGDAELHVAVTVQQGRRLCVSMRTVESPLQHRQEIFVIKKDNDWATKRCISI